MTLPAASGWLGQKPKMKNPARKLNGVYRVIESKITVSLSWTP